MFWIEVYRFGRVGLRWNLEVLAETTGRRVRQGPATLASGFYRPDETRRVAVSRVVGYHFSPWSPAFVEEVRFGVGYTTYPGFCAFVVQALKEAS